VNPGEKFSYLKSLTIALFSSMEELEGLFLSNLSTGDAVLFKGSRSYRIERAVGILEGLSSWK